MRSILLSAVLLLLVFCLGMVAVSGVGVLGFSLHPPQISVPPVPEVGDVYFAPQPPEMDAPDLSASVALQMDEIQAQVVQVRGLIPQRGVYRDVLTSAELHQRVMDDFLEEFTQQDAEEYAQVLAVLGLIEPGTELHQVFIDLYSEQVAGFYDPKTEAMFVVQGDVFGGAERMTYAHEYTHALQDQVYDLQDGLQMDDETCQEKSETCAAVTALIEGDATLTEQLWFIRNSTEEDLQQLQEFAFNFKTPMYDALPEFLQEDFLFPYREGAEFVSTLYDRGGFAEVDAAYDNLPQSTEQILHPEKYPNDEPHSVILPEFATLLDPAWHEIDDSVLGEWYTFLVLAYGAEEKARLPLAEARLAAAGWKGDRYVVYQKDSTDTSVLVLNSLWDTEQDAREFTDAFSRYGKVRWGNVEEGSNGQMFWQSDSDGVVVFLRQGSETLWVIAPETEIVKLIIQEAGFLLED
jgi:hypothetical protein